ncbi:MAG: single-stranded DNA-binding protein [Desulfovibrio sp.]|nr:single-stranded DNA-binding protein [Desulfovibrio sp.]
MLNRVMIIGRLGQDPQLKYSQSGSPIATFSVATDETFTDRDGIRQQRTEWFKVVAFARIAESCAHYLHKGNLVYVEGSLQTRRWQDQQGMEHSLVEIKAIRVDFLDRRGQNNEDFGRRGYHEGEAGQQNFESMPGQTSYARVPDADADFGKAPAHDPVFPQDAMGEVPAKQPPLSSPLGQTRSEDATSSNESAKPDTIGSEQTAKMDEVPF